MNASEGLLVEPAFRSAPSFTQTLGPEVADLCELAGFAPDPEQRLGLDLIFALNRRGKSAAFEFAAICCRQNLKTGLFKQAALGWLFITEERLIVWSAHEFDTAREAFRDLTILIESNEYLDRRVKHIHRANGSEAIELVNGPRLIFKARTKAGGRGLTGDKVVLDEAFALQPDHMGALLPTLSVRPDPQVLYGSSAGLVNSYVLRGVRDRGRAGTSPRLAYLEWCAPQGGCEDEKCEHELRAAGCALDDEVKIQQANPLLGRTRENGTGLTLEHVRSEREAMPPLEFARERLGWWDEPPPEEGGAFELERWLAAADPEAVRGRKVVFGVDVGEDRAAHVAVAWRRPGGVQVMLAATGLSPTATPGRLSELARTWRGPVMLGGPAAALDGEVSRSRVVSAAEFAASCGRFDDLLRAGEIRHGNQPELNEAVRVARWRSVGTAGERAFQLKDAPAVGPLAAVVRALHGLIGAPVKPPPTPKAAEGPRRVSETADLSSLSF